MDNINRLPKFDYSEELKVSMREATKAMERLAEEAAREMCEFDEAWDKRAREVAELERLYGKA